MSSSLAIFLPQDLSDIDAIVEGFREEFDEALKDLFTDEELALLEPKLEALGAVFVQPILSELTFDDFYASEEQESKQRDFFEKCRTTITIENLPFLETNPFQVSYLKELLGKFPEALIDRGGVFEILFKKDYLHLLECFKDMMSLTGGPKVTVKTPVKSSAPVDPIDFLIRDVYRELDRLGEREIPSEELSPKLQKILLVLRSDRSGDATELLRKTGLNAKDFDDGLEGLKFRLRKL